MIDSEVTVIGVQRVLPGVLIELVRRQPTTPAKVDFAWRTAVGPGIARASRVSLGEDGVLTVAVDDPHWRREIQHSLPLVRARLERLLGDAVASITVAAP
jgi:predicted nucleic acid-binding Zn ribbon protein